VNYIDNDLKLPRYFPSGDRGR